MSGEPWWTDEDFQAASSAAFEVRDDPYDLTEWDEADAVERELYECQARAVLAALAPTVERIRREAKAEALREFEARITTQTPGRICEDLLAEAARIEAGGDDE